MNRFCAWCNTKLDTVESGNALSDVSTHGICEKCADNMEFQMGASLEKYLNSLPAPIIAIDADCRLINANQAALKLIGKDIFQSRGVLAGDVFECAHARLPEGCGKTAHCNGCVIRNSVRETWQTGRECTQVPAILNHYSSPANEAQRFLISTKKLNQLVLLKIETVRDEQDSSEKKAF